MCVCVFECAGIHVYYKDRLVKDTSIKWHKHLLWKYCLIFTSTKTQSSHQMHFQNIQMVLKRHTFGLPKIYLILVLKLGQNWSKFLYFTFVFAYTSMIWWSRIIWGGVYMLRYLLFKFERYSQLVQFVILGARWYH